MWTAKGRKQMGNPDCRTRALRATENLRLVDVPTDPEDEDRRQEPDREQRAPGDLLGKESIEPGVNQCRGAPPHPNRFERCRRHARDTCRGSPRPSARQRLAI